MATPAHSLCLAAAAAALACTVPGDAVVPARVDTGAFDGAYAVVPERFFSATRRRIEAEPDEKRREAGQRVLQMQLRRAR